METQIRLAEARGSLAAPNSSVQDRALQCLILIRERDRQRDRLDRVRVAVLHQPVDSERAALLFPEIFPSDAYAKARREDGSYDIDRVDDSKIDWSIPDQATDADLSAWIKEHESASVSAAELDEWR